MALKGSIVTFHRAPPASFSYRDDIVSSFSALHGTSHRAYDIKLIMAQGFAPPLNLIREWLAGNSQLAEDHI